MKNGRIEGRRRERDVRPQNFQRENRQLGENHDS